MDKIYVSIGHPHSRKVILQKVAVFADEKNMNSKAKELRKEVAENAEFYGFRTTTGGFVRFTPGELYWAIFEDVADEIPTLYSDNYFSGVLGEITLKYDSWYNQGYFDAKNNDYYSPNLEVNREEYDRGISDYISSIEKLGMEIS